MNHPNPPHQPGPYGPPPPGQQPPPYRPPQPPPYGQQPPPYRQQPPPYRQPPTPPGGQPPPHGQPATPPGGQPPFGPPSTPPGGQPPPFGQPQSDYPPPPDYPPAPTGGEPAKPSGKRKLLVGIIALVVAAGAYAIFQFVLNKDSASSAEAGDCIKVNRASTTSADVEKIDCNDNIAVFKVAKKLDNDTDQCPTPDYEKYTQTGAGSDFALCLMLNAKEGDCFADYDTPDKRARVDCASAEVKVAKLVSGTADEKACEQDSLALVYPEPATTFCLVQPQGL
ncbi:MAG TPA: hypothetical protein VGX25_34240 [Actinophytocola sp.]|uniref:LppU/SCO3897 family protein n=1 Tax=Actinophytocola sp. TaxID=1872138 RepID=UPI002DDCECEA|nr:hypothetical protein [Actinophytocola sp.]HEV2784475.1 hypothetical protein [Actinophytocola sp.]